MTSLTKPVLCILSGRLSPSYSLLIFFFNDTATTEIYTLSLHDALPILRGVAAGSAIGPCGGHSLRAWAGRRRRRRRSEEHTSELQSPDHLVCRLLLEKKKRQTQDAFTRTPSDAPLPPPPQPPACRGPQE